MLNIKQLAFTLAPVFVASTTLPACTSAPKRDNSPTELNSNNALIENSAAAKPRSFSQFFNHTFKLPPNDENLQRVFLEIITVPNLLSSQEQGKQVPDVDKKIARLQTYLNGIINFATQGDSTVDFPKNIEINGNFDKATAESILWFLKAHKGTDLLGDLRLNDDLFSKKLSSLSEQLKKLAPHEYEVFINLPTLEQDETAIVPKKPNLEKPGKFKI